MSNPENFRKAFSPLFVPGSETETCGGAVSNSFRFENHIDGRHRAARSRAGERDLFKAAGIDKRAMWDLSSWHEAAHAVVGVRLGMTLHSIDIGLQFVRGKGGEIALSSGYTSYLVNPLTERLGAVAAFRARAVFAAAGMVAEEERKTVDLVAIRDDFEGIRRYASALGYPSDRSNPIFNSFYAASHKRAHTLLLIDGGAAWERTQKALRRHQTLTPAMVTNLVGETGSLDT
jgi:hypothetical protein